MNHRRERTADGHERTIQANHFAPFLLTTLLLPRLRHTASLGRDVRIIATASVARRFGDLRLDDLDWSRRPWRGDWPAYGTAKIATILFTEQLAEVLTGTGIAAYSFHPGFVVTNFGATSLIRLGSANGIAPTAGAAPLERLAAEAKVGAPTGSYFDRFRANGKRSEQAREAQLGRDLWTVTERIVGVQQG
ncbi:hypothetical protein [Leifsonia xyli]|uniref:hypothetical protein n=1 Tax=Leifsonia xyli TaxID=1575 RepID=UPI0002E0F538|nr:hypothetical protein [Leifsonia xyli]